MKQKKTQQNWGSIDCFRVKNNCFPGETAILFFKLILGQYFPPYVKSSKKSFLLLLSIKIGEREIDF